MSGQELARVDKVPLRSVWAHEQTGFSAWLTKNIDLLNDQLPFQLDPESLHQEARAGAFSVDIVGDAVGLHDGEPFKVVIENQIEQTDHTHLGQVLTYVAAYGAKAAVWISANARPEHAKAVQWLNDESSIDAWLFDIEVIRIDQSRPAPILTRIVGPSALSKKAKAERQSDAADNQLKRAFWTEVLPTVADAVRDQGAFQGKNPPGSVNISHAIPGSPGPIHWQLWVTSHGSWACVRVSGESQEEADHYYQHLWEQRDSVEAAFGGQLVWDALENNLTSVIRWDNPVAGGFRDDPSVWSAAAGSMADAVARLVAATAPVVAALPTYEPEPEPAGVQDEELEDWKEVT